MTQEQCTYLIEQKYDFFQGFEPEKDLTIIQQYKDYFLTKQERINDWRKPVDMPLVDSYKTNKLASNGATTNTTYYQVNDQTVAQKNPDGSKNYFLTDNLGSASVLTNQSGAVVENSTYYPYGQIRSGGTQSKYLYTGQENDPETNLDYYNSRYYNPSNMHFTQPDTVLPNVYDPQSLNRYSYVENNPLTYSDPSGHCIPVCLLANPWTIALIATAAVAVYETITHPAQTKAVATYVVNTAVNIPNALNNAAKTISTAVSKQSTPTGGQKTSAPLGNISRSSSPGNSSGPNINNPMQKIGPAIPIAANNTWQKIKDNGLQPLEGYSSKVYKNVTEPFLPEKPLGTYMEHDVFPEGSNGEREMHRLVIDTSTGQAWYTYHYLDGFVPFEK